MIFYASSGGGFGDPLKWLPTKEEAQPHITVSYPSGCSRAGKARPAGARPSTGRLASKRLARLFQRLARSPGRAAAGFFNGLSAGSADDRCFVPECCLFDTAFE